MKLNMDKATQYLSALKTMPPVTGKVGYAIYRNITLLDAATKEYRMMRDELINKYGSGGMITKESPNFTQFLEELAPLVSIECDVDFFTIDADELYNDALSSNDYFVLQEIAVRHD